MDFIRLKEFLDSLIPYGIPGVDMLIMQDHQPVFRYYTGMRDRENHIPMCGDERYFLYSCSKVITVAAAAQLLEKGLFLLSDPLYAYLPEYRRMPLRMPDGSIAEAENSITIQNLFTMTAGLNYDWETPAILKVKEAASGSPATREVVRAIAQSPLDFEPGTHWQYSLCHDVLGGLIEVVSGQRFADYVQTHIFDPLEMKRSCFHLLPEEEKELAAQYVFDDEKRAAIPIERERVKGLGINFDSGGAGVISCVEDYGKFMDALACGGMGANHERILASATIELIRQNYLTDEQMKDFNWIQMRGYGYGLGVRTMVNRAAGGSIGPVGEFGWGGAAGAYVSIDPSRRLSAYYAQHMRNNQETYIHPRLRNIIYSCIE